VPPRRAAQLRDHIQCEILNKLKINLMDVCELLHRPRCSGPRPGNSGPDLFFFAVSLIYSCKKIVFLVARHVPPESLQSPVINHCAEVSNDALAAESSIPIRFQNFPVAGIFVILFKQIVSKIKATLPFHLCLIYR
jgi:hypothetical protein